MSSFLSKLFAVSAILFVVTGAFAATGSVSLTWDTNPEPDIAGYNVYGAPPAVSTSNLTMCTRRRR